MIKLFWRKTKSWEYPIIPRPGFCRGSIRPSLSQDNPKIKTLVNLGLNSPKISLNEILDTQQ